MNKALLILLIVFCSCSKKDVEYSTVHSTSYLGKWYYNHFLEDGEKFIVDQNSTNENCDNEKDWYVEFTVNSEYIEFSVKECLENKEISRFIFDGNKLSFYDQNDNLLRHTNVLLLSFDDLVFEYLEDGKHFEHHFKRRL